MEIIDKAEMDDVYFTISYEEDHTPKGTIDFYSVIDVTFDINVKIRPTRRILIDSDVNNKFYISKEYIRYPDEYKDYDILKGKIINSDMRFPCYDIDMQWYLDKRRRTMGRSLDRIYGSGNASGSDEDILIIEYYTKYIDRYYS
jgi:hypothetical protein